MGQATNCKGLCQGTGYIKEVVEADGQGSEVIHLRSFDPDLENNDFVGTVWCCPDCWFLDPPGGEA